MPSKDVDKLRRWRREWYERNKDRQIARQRDRKAELREKLAAHKSMLSCARCGFSFAGRPECCDFHHLNGDDKVDGLSKMVGRSWASILREIAKCVPLCANCHRIEHAPR